MNLHMTVYTHNLHMTVFIWTMLSKGYSLSHMTVYKFSCPANWSQNGKICTQLFASRNPEIVTWTVHKDHHVQRPLAVIRCELYTAVR